MAKITELLHHGTGSRGHRYPQDAGEFPKARTTGSHIRSRCRWDI